MDIRPISDATLGDADELFAGSAVTRGCRCMWFLLTTKEVETGWGEGNRVRFERLVTEAGEPAGLLAYEGGRAVAWCAAGPRSRYARAHGATAVEGFPLAGTGPHRNDRYLGTEPLFAACGFHPVARPSARRVVMRLDLSPRRDPQPGHGRRP